VSATQRRQTNDDRADADATPVEELSFTDASRELDRIVEFFDQRDVDVDQLVTRLERATEIVDELDRRIRRTRAQVEELVPRLEAVSKGEEHAAGLAATDAPSASVDAPSTGEGDWDTTGEGPEPPDDDPDHLF
jgi:exonuclease VII small subunit